MRTKPGNGKGSAIVMVLMLSAVSSMVVASYLGYSTQSGRATMRMLDFQKAQLAAEAALEYGVLQLRDVLLANQFKLDKTHLQTLLNEVPLPTPVGEYQYATPNGQPAFRITVDNDVVSGVITAGVACVGSDGEYEWFTITAGAINRDTGVGAVLQQRLQGLGLFLIRYAVFYDRDLEINPGAPMMLTGPVHCNANIYLAPDNSTLRCNDRLTAASDMYRHRKDSSGNTGYVGVDNASGSEIPMSIDSTYAEWMVKAIELWQGRVLSGVHGIEKLVPPISPVDVPHDLLERPLDPDDPDYQEQTEKEKYANKACIRMHVNASNVLKVVDCKGSDLTACFTNACLEPSGDYFDDRPEWEKGEGGRYVMLTNGAYCANTNGFFDKREGVTMLPLDIYVDRLTNCCPNVANTYYTVPEGRGLIYVTRDKPDVTNDVMPCVRIRNALNLPEGGLSIASDLPVYVEGFYNVTNRQPTFVAGDAITFLSRNWQDARSWSSKLKDRTAKSTAYYVVIMTSNRETSWGEEYSGGLENSIRFLEHWSGKTVTFRGAIINLWQAEEIDGEWSYGDYYTAPNRDWGYDEMYRTNVPPGMTRVFGLEEIQWQECSWADVGWN